MLTCITLDSGEQCESCGHNPSTYDVGDDPYKEAANLHPFMPTMVTIAKPCMVNPSSIKTVQEVAQNIEQSLPEGK